MRKDTELPDDTTTRSSARFGTCVLSLDLSVSWTRGDGSGWSSNNSFPSLTVQWCYFVNDTLLDRLDSTVKCMYPRILS